MKDVKIVFDYIRNSGVSLPMVIFIDDLDRCSPDKVANVMAAVNLFLGGQFIYDCMFIMGVDAEIIAAALEDAHSKIIAQLSGLSLGAPLGWRFMDKFVQLPIAIPPPEQEDIHRYIEDLLELDEAQQLKRKKINEIADKVETKLTSNSDVNQIADETTMEYHISDKAECDLLGHELEKKRRRKELDKKIDDYSDLDEGVRGLMRDTTSAFSNNPRDLKRFMNVFRFDYFLLLARQNRGLNVPSNSQLARWIALTLKWPEFAR